MASQEVLLSIVTFVLFTTNPTQPDTVPQLRNILLLDKSTAPFASQLEEARSILGIKLSTLNHTVDQGSQRSTHSGPREEWTLRWLLKKFEASKPEPRRYDPLSKCSLALH